jgi:hypothetical protein
MNTIQEREDAMVASILSGDNHCKTLENAAKAADGDYFRRAVRPTLEVYEDEAEYARRQRDMILEQSEKRRQALEFVASNATLPESVARVVGVALGRVL